MPRYSVQHFDTARKMLDYLNPLDTDRWPPGRFIFRGQPDMDLSLEPSAHRVMGPVSAPARFGTKGITCGQQVIFEQEVLEVFIAACDSAGLSIPGDTSQVRHLVMDREAFQELPQCWPPPELLKPLAFAQHHGVPTCLLDWTRRSYVAAYFAASSALASPRRLEVEQSRLVVWALNAEVNAVNVIEAPGGTSPNLAAQSGLFTASPIQGGQDDPFLPFGLQSRSEVCESDALPFGLERISLGFDQAGELLKGCELLGVSGATLFPGFEGISRKVKDWAHAELQGFDPSEIALRDII